VNKHAGARPLVAAQEGVTLVAAGPVGRRDLARAVARAPVVVAADGGADRALRLGIVPRAVIGDLDSLSDGARARLPPAACHLLAEQETTDFDKALRSIRAPFVIAVGVLGGRVDHALAAFSTLIAARKMPVVALGAEDVAFAAPRRLSLDLRAGDRLSIYPLRPLRGTSRGLDWPIDGLRLAADGRIGTSNRVTSGRVDLTFDRRGAVVILAAARLDAALAALSPGASAAVRGG
jgi:thiamine pyrophosphokinase